MVKFKVYKKTDMTFFSNIKNINRILSNKKTTTTTTTTKNKIKLQKQASE